MKIKKKYIPIAIKVHRSYHCHLLITSGSGSDQQGTGDDDNKAKESYFDNNTEWNVDWEE